MVEVKWHWSWGKMLLIGLVSLCLLCFVIASVPLVLAIFDGFYWEPSRRQQAEEAIVTYPDSILVDTQDPTGDDNYALQSYFYVTEDDLEDVRNFYSEHGIDTYSFQGEDLEWYQTYNDLDHILRAGVGPVITAHEDICERETYADCISVILIEVTNDGQNQTLIIISYWFTFL